MKERHYFIFRFYLVTTFLSLLKAQVSTRVKFVKLTQNQLVINFFQEYISQSNGFQNSNGCQSKHNRKRYKQWNLNTGKMQNCLYINLFILSRGELVPLLHIRWNSSNNRNSFQPLNFVTKSSILSAASVSVRPIPKGKNKTPNIKDQINNKFFVTDASTARKKK